MTENIIGFGWFSVKQMHIIKGYYVYLNEDGKEVIITDVFPDREKKSSFDDAIYIGKVTQFIRKVTQLWETRNGQN